MELLVHVLPGNLTYVLSLHTDQLSTMACESKVGRVASDDFGLQENSLIVAFHTYVP